MKLYAAFGEYGDIWPTTVRRTEAEAIAALRGEPGISTPDDPFQHGVCLGTWEHQSSFFGEGRPADPDPLEITWLHGYRSRREET